MAEHDLHEFVGAVVAQIMLEMGLFAHIERFAVIDGSDDIPCGAAACHEVEGGEAACHVYSHLYAMRTVCLRFFTVYGARQRPDLAIYKFARLIDAGRAIPLFGDGRTKRDYTYIDDIIAGVVAALRYEASDFEIINLGESTTVELRRLVELLEQALGKRAIIDHQPAQPGDVPVTFANIDKARRLLGYHPQTKIDAGIERFVAWFKSGESITSLK